MYPTTESSGEARLRVDTSLDHSSGSRLAEDARIGLTAERKWLPAMHLYDERGSRLFDAICDTPEYYPTRTEAALLEDVVDELMEAARPTHLVELGSGAARKTRILLEGMWRVCRGRVFVPMDVSASMLRRSGEQLIRDYPWLEVHGVVGDYAETLAVLPRGDRRLVAFLGGTIGNYEDDVAIEFLSRVRAVLHEGDTLLLGADLVKDRAVLHAAYNDGAGLTAAFNKNLLNVLNRELGADFDTEGFEHVAFFDERRARIEMHLRSKRAQRVRVPALAREISFVEGETLHTEISRKFTRPRIEALLGQSGFALDAWYTPANDYFSLSLAAPR